MLQTNNGPHRFIYKIFWKQIKTVVFGNYAVDAILSTQVNHFLSAAAVATKTNSLRQHSHTHT